MVKPYIEEQFKYKGFDCAILFQTMGFRTGYVKIPENHPMFGKSYNDIDVYCHGGLTYSRPYLVGISDKGDGHWWIGFDCAHYGDANDYYTATKLFKFNPDVLKTISHSAMLDEEYPTYGVVRSLDYCKRECEHIVDQLIEMGDKQ